MLSIGWSCQEMGYARPYFRILWEPSLMTRVLVLVVATMAVKVMQTGVNALLLLWAETDDSARAR